MSSFDIETDDLHAALKEIKTLEVMIANEDYFGSLKETDISLVKSKAAIGEIILDSVCSVPNKLHPSDHGCFP